MPSSFSVSAPCKLILCGEHYVVYGAPAIAVPIELRNEVEVSKLNAGDNRMLVDGLLGNFDFSKKKSDIPKEATLYYTAYKTACEKIGRTLQGFRFSVSRLQHPKGLGNSSSVAACLAAACFSAAGKKFTPQDIFECSQAADLATTDGRASGIDAMTVTSITAQAFTRSFNPDKYNFTPLEMHLPNNTSLVLIDTFNGKRSTTRQQVEKFANSFGVKGTPAQLSQKERDKINEKYLKIFEKIKAEISSKNPTAEKLGKLMLENHVLLASHGVSTPALDEVVGKCLSCGAWGAKLTAAGGVGGAVVVLCPNEKLGEIHSIAKKLGFRASEVPFAGKGILIS